MSPFKLYFPLGFNHIADLAAYDHILFLVALCGMFTVKNWRHLLGLISAFSLGHTLTLALCAFQVIRPNVQVVELLIPVTILFTAFSNVVDYSNRRLVLDKVGYKYVLTGLFGLIHGMGFSNYFAFLITGETHIGRPLFYFTLGIEVGQVVIVGVILLLAHLMRTLFFFKGTEWNLFLSGIAAGISFLMVIEKSAFLFAAPLTVSTEVQAPVCPDQPNGSIQVTAQGGFPEYRYYWSTGQQTPSLSGLAPGTYSVTVEDEQSQVATATVTVPAPEPFSVQIVKDSTSVNWRFGATAKVMGGKPEYRYLWSDGQTGRQALSLLPGTYGLTVTDQNGCTARSEAVIGQ